MFPHAVSCLFIAGVASVIPLQWFQLFDEREIQVLISGAEVAINVEDLMVNTHYSECATMNILRALCTVPAI